MPCTIVMNRRMTEASKTQGMTFDDLVSSWQLQPHPEGGWYREVQRSGIQVQRPDGKQRCAITTVLFLLCSDDLSRWHRVQGEMRSGPSSAVPL